MTREPVEGHSWLRSRSGAVLLAFLAISGFFVVTEHTAHVLGALPYLLLLACPLLHWLHGGHRGAHGGGHGDHREGDGHSGERGEQ